MDPRWRVRKPDGVVYGPADTETVRKWLQEQRISPHDQIALEGTENWRPVSETVEFQDLLQPARGRAPTTSTRNRQLAIGVGAFALLCVVGILAAVFAIKSLVAPTKKAPPHEEAFTEQKGAPKKASVTAAQERNRISRLAEPPEVPAVSEIPEEEPKEPELLTAEPARQQAVPKREIAPSQPVAPTGPNLIRNGDFSGGFEAWDKFHSSNVSDKWNLQIEGDDRYVSWSRTRSLNDGGSVGVVQTMNVDAAHFKKLVLSLDVMVKDHTLLNPGWWSESRGGSGEYPAKIILFYHDIKGKQHMWTHGFLSTVRRQPVDYRDPKTGIEEHHDTETTLANYTMVPRNEWYHYEVDLLGEGRLIEADLARRGNQMPRPHRIIMIRVVGEGWDFASSVDNIKLYGE